VGIVNPLADFVCKAWVGGAFPARFAIERNHPIEQESLKIKELEHVAKKSVTFFKELL
jgi:hypothetical protein